MRKSKKIKKAQKKLPKYKIEGMKMIKLGREIQESIASYVKLPPDFDLIEFIHKNR